MKTGILAGGVGTRIQEESVSKPKPMVEIGGKPILWHIMKHYEHFGFDRFVIALGYKGEYIKRYMLDYCSLGANMSIDFRSGAVSTSARCGEQWTVELVDTGQETATGGRIKRLAPHLGPGTFFLTWGDGVSDVDLRQLLAFHKSHGRLATVTAVRPPARFGKLELDGDVVTRFSEKPLEEGWINGAFFVLEPGVVDYVDGDDTQWEREPLERLAQDGQLMAFKHASFWQCMDTLRDKKLLETLWSSGKAPWKLWS
ncbi:MAG: glucose-1-phosphate cytidylyltransferase [Planctomycetes bacterium]|nr:glucose-1-phosphate cytidylyltransferase [Planctomycetota bacterium]